MFLYIGNQSIFIISGYAGTRYNKRSNWSKSFRDSRNDTESISISMLYQVFSKNIFLFFNLDLLAIFLSSIKFIEKNFILKCFSDRFIRSIAGSFPMFMTMSWIFGSAILVKSIVYEKEQRLKETMKVNLDVHYHKIYFIN